MKYNPPVNEMLFLIRDIFRINDDVIDHILTEAAKLGEEVILPTNQLGDKGCIRNQDGSVTTPASFRTAFNEFVSGGWIGLDVPEVYGGQGQSALLATAVNEIISSSNMALSMYPGLTRGAIEAILVSGTESQKEEYIPNMVSGKWTGTMNLTEPHCGTDLGLLKTRAKRNDDGTFSITGQKIFISCGEHDLSENIIHLVLARIEGAPEGTKGISMFIVPKFIGSNKNSVSCGSIEEKMGIHGSSTCVMNYDAATGYLIGEENRGLNAMFIMMNSARLNVAIQGLSQSELAYQNALTYAKDRLQGRSLTGVKNPNGPADPIIVHPDVRRMLLDIKAFNEAARFLIYSAAIDSDLANNAPDTDVRLAAEERLSLLTPVLKGVLTDIGFENTVKAQQVLGGHGYVKEWGLEQIVRDARICQIYEGANGIQALDLVGRKLPKNGGRAIQTFFKESEGALNALGTDPDMLPYVEPVKGAVADLKSATMWLVQNAMSNPNNAGSASYDYMHLFGLVSMGMAWAMIARAALEKKNIEPDSKRWNSKLNTAAYFMQRMLPETALRLARIKAGSGVMMSLSEDEF